MTAIEYFKKLCEIPHGSYNEKQISDYIFQFAKENGFRARQDEANNVIVFKDGSKGRENEEPVILQSHLDMVCVKREDCDKDFLTEGIDIESDGEWIWAKGTSLGADDGVGVALMQAILMDETKSHPPIECIFTTCEEKGLLGAKAIELSDIKGKRLINLDSSNENIIMVSCSGGMRMNLAMNLPEADIPADFVPCKFTVSGLKGGHSGGEIHLGRAMSHKLMASLLVKLPFGIPSAMKGGVLENVICNYTEAVVWAPKDKLDVLKDYAASCETQFKADYPKDDGVKVDFEVLDDFEFKNDFRSAAQLLDIMPCGVFAMMEEFPIPQTSANLAVVNTYDGEVKIRMSARSCINEEKTVVAEMIRQVCKAFDCSFEVENVYPAWPYKRESAFRDKAVEVYKKCFGKAPRLILTHAGLECGILSGKIKDLDCISFSPDAQYLHSYNERLSIASTNRVFECLLTLIEEL